MVPANSSKRVSNGHKTRRAPRSTNAGTRKPHGQGSSKFQSRLLKKFTMILRFAFQNPELCMSDVAVSSQSANDAGHHPGDHNPLLMTSNARKIIFAFIRTLANVTLLRSQNTLAGISPLLKKVFYRLEDPYSTTPAPGPFVAILECIYALSCKVKALSPAILPPYMNIHSFIDDSNPLYPD